MHTNLGHPSNHALGKAIRVSGGSAAAVRAAHQLRCDVCERQQHPGPHLPARLRTDREFGDTAAIDLFVLADYEGNQLSFVNILDLASTFGVVAMIPSKHPKIVWDHFFKHWITPFGVPRKLIYDQGGEFEREFGQELENLGCELMPTAAITPQQNAVCWTNLENSAIDDSGTLLRSGFSDGDRDCLTRSNRETFFAPTSHER